MKDGIDSLGMIVGKSEAHDDSKMSKALYFNSFKKFLRIAAVFRQFIKNFSALAMQLTNLTKTTKEKTFRMQSVQKPLRNLKM